jgi:hypothetical protein
LIEVAGLAFAPGNPLPGGTNGFLKSDGAEAGAIPAELVPLERLSVTGAARQSTEIGQEYFGQKYIILPLPTRKCSLPT